MMRHRQYKAKSLKIRISHDGEDQSTDIGDITRASETARRHNQMERTFAEQGERKGQGELDAGTDVSL